MTKTPVPFNLNDYIYFKPNEKSYQVYRTYYHSINVFGLSLDQLKQENGMVKMQMHEFIRIYGRHFNIGGNPPIEDMNVEVEIKPVCPVVLEAKRKKA